LDRPVVFTLHKLAHRRSGVRSAVVALATVRRHDLTVRRPDPKRELVVLALVGLATSRHRDSSGHSRYFVYRYIPYMADPVIALDTGRSQRIGQTSSPMWRPLRARRLAPPVSVRRCCAL